MLSEKVELLGKGLYDDIPPQLTLTSMPTVTELDYVGAEDFDEVMLDTILPKCVKEKINFRKLLEIDYQWVCRALRLLNYGPYHTTNSIYCSKCGKVSSGEYRVDLRTIPCNPLPEGFKNDIVIDKSKFLDFESDIHISLFTIQDQINAYKDNAFKNELRGRVNTELARICYMIKSIGDDSGLTPIQVKLTIDDKISPADYIILKDEVNKLTDYGLRAGGTCTCPKCHSTEAAFIALMDDKFFRPTVGDLREWRNDKSTRKSN